MASDTKITKNMKQLLVRRNHLQMNNHNKNKNKNIQNIF